MAAAAKLRRIHGHVLLAALGIVLARPTLATNLLGGLIVLMGLALRVWAAGFLEKGGLLCADGPYRHVRHPLYLGSLVAAIGFCVMMKVLWGWGIVLPLFLVLYAAQVVAEEQLLRREYGEAHADFARRVPLLVPQLRAAPRGEGRSWTWKRVSVNREHYHVLITLLLLAGFYVKAALR